MTTAMKILTGTLCLLFGHAAQALAPANPAMRLECVPVAMGGWTVLVQENAFVLIATRADEHLRGSAGIRLSQFSFMVARVDEEGAVAPQAHWQPVPLPVTTFVLPCPFESIAGLAAEDQAEVHIIHERMAAQPLLTWTVAPRSWFTGTTPVSPASSDEVPGKMLPEFRLITDIRHANSSASAVRLALSHPSLASFHGRVLLACNAGGRNAVTWVGALAESTDRSIDSVLLGPGRAPALVAAEERIWCLAIDGTPQHRWPAGDVRVRGCLVGWKSADAVQWEPWVTGVPLENVVRVDACTDGETTLVACLTAAPEPRIHVYRLDPAKEGLTEVLTVDPAPEGELGRDIAIRLLKGKAYLFWQDNVGVDKAALLHRDHAGEGRTYIVMRPLDLPAPDEAAAEDATAGAVREGVRGTEGGVVQQGR